MRWRRQDGVRKEGSGGARPARRRQGLRACAGLGGAARPPDGRVHDLVGGRRPRALRCGGCNASCITCATTSCVHQHPLPRPRPRCGVALPASPGCRARGAQRLGAESLAMTISRRATELTSIAWQSWALMSSGARDLLHGERLRFFIWHRGGGRTYSTTGSGVEITDDAFTAGFGCGRRNGDGSIEYVMILPDAPTAARAGE